MSDFIAPVLERAVELIRVHGWVPDRIYNGPDKTKYTASKAIMQAADEHGGIDGDQFYAIYDAITTHVFGQDCRYQSSVSQWNRSASYREVVGVLRMVAGKHKPVNKNARALKTIAWRLNHPTPVTVADALR